MEIDLHFHVVQYVDDPFIAEGRNVAILAHHLGKGYFRALGVNRYQFAPSHFKSLSPKARASFWVYEEWLNWFRSISNMQSVKQFDEAISRLSRENSGLIASHEGVLALTGADIFNATDAMDSPFRNIPAFP